MFSAPMPLTSSSAIDTETTGILSAVRPAFVYSLKNATLVSPLRVLNTTSGLAALTLVTIVANVGVAERRVLLADDLDAVGRRRTP